MTTKRQVEKFESNTGVRIYRIPMLVFPKFVGYSYLLFGAGVLTLFDTGSGFGQSNDDLLAGLAAVKNNFSEDFNLSDIERIILTHGHTDHIGGLTHILEAIDGATIGIHPLDRRILTNYEERRTVATKDLMIFFERAGVPNIECKNSKKCIIGASSTSNQSKSILW
ncbi:MAG: MBL fold metallo-hydrolase [Anaerolineae bacterium]|nr:MBL fold metallo-hydrolase [Anaerolineae bacterium]